MAIIDRTNNISVMYIRNFLGLNENLDTECLDVGTLCTKAKNKWSKYKPVRFLYENTESTPDWYKSRDGNCGLNVPIYSTMAAMFSALRSNSTMWEYLKPRGGDYGEFYRLLDFINYDSEAQPPFVPSELNQKYFATFGTLPVALDLNMPSSTELSLSDINGAINLSNCYFGVAICKQGTSGYKYMTENVTLFNGGGGGIAVPISNELGTYEVVYFLAESPKLSFSDPDIVNRFIPIPDALKTVIIETSPISVFVSGTFALMTANYEITIVNNHSSSLILNGCNIAFRYGNKLPTDALVMGEKNKSLGTVTVQGNSSITLSGSITSVGADYDSLGGYLWFSNSTNAAYNQMGDFEEEL